MISKVIIGKKSGGGFYGAAKYILRPESKPEVLASKELRDHDYRLIAKDFNFVCSQRPTINSNVFHGILSFSEADNVNDSLMKEIAEAYIIELGLNNSPWIIIKHSNAKKHCHILSSLINSEGNLVDRKYIGWRGKQASISLSKRYNLAPVKGKNMALINSAKLNKEQRTRYEIYTLLNTARENASNFNQFLQIIDSVVEIQFKYKRGSESEIQGISFRHKKNGLSFKGSQIDPEFSYSKLIKFYSTSVEIKKHRPQFDSLVIKKEPLSEPSNQNLVIGSSPLLDLPIEDFTTNREWEYDDDLKRKRRKKQLKKRQ